MEIIFSAWYFLCHSLFSRRYRNLVEGLFTPLNFNENNADLFPQVHVKIDLDVKHNILMFILIIYYITPDFQAQFDHKVMMDSNLLPSSTNQLQRRLYRNPSRQKMNFLITERDFSVNCCK